MTITTRMIRALRARQRAVTSTGDAGTTMIEMFTAMILMTICGAVFTGAIVSLFRAANQAQAITGSNQQNNQAYQTLDRTVRYAAAISTPGKSTVIGGTGDWYVELRNTTDGTERCTQLRLDIATGQLQRRTWKATDVPGSTFQPLASGLTNGTAVAGPTTQPFYLVPITGTPEASAYPSASSAPKTLRHQILLFNLSAKAGLANQPVSSLSTFTLTALNSSIPVPTGAICQAGRP